MPYPKSVSLICTAAELSAANLALNFAPLSPADPTVGNRGIGNITVPISATGDMPATHYGTHAWDDGLAALFEDAEIAATMPMIQARIVENPNGSTVGFHGFLDSLGLMRILPAVE
ncbi:hypothetical protein [Sphingomonas colocasiae]|uniref:Uncharacterized protein n=1 Tax=Sphingomonas colocasiae TaxID=1848973 RepID=A0ABS7PKM9_9SPHN|nr:hypothetical protein [Sphingomonas colocasiae]MBY8821858.1 hypothetical protein [Sphingomonas colocasiae]